MTTLTHTTGNATARHFRVEDFRTFAHSELLLAAPWQAGICFRPECGQAFEPSRDWQIYCCTSCERAGNAELRKWGNRLALPTLAHRLGIDRRGPQDADLRAMSLAAGRHIRMVTTAWIEDRTARAEGVGHG